jgi:hypothetical protein
MEGLTRRGRAAHAGRRESLIVIKVSGRRGVCGSGWAAPHNTARVPAEVLSRCTRRWTHRAPQLGKEWGGALKVSPKMNGALSGLRDSNHSKLIWDRGVPNEC